MPDIVRTTSREQCFIRAFVNGYTGQVRDITREGMKIALFGDLKVCQKDTINVKIIPDESMKIPSFYLRGTVRWVKNESFTLILGFQYTTDANMSSVVYLNKILKIWKQ
ncbi:MAG: PilZ domain-containing protein [Spirochaetales bacterium]|nr:PilZ domain-containing protein [Spirochaetales bacterium]